jgi:hypothetical protein
VTYENPNVDPLTEAIEAIQYGSSDDAGPKLRSAFDAIHTERERRDLRAAEIRRSAAHAQKIAAENPEWSNDRGAAPVREATIAEQKADLELVGAFDRKKFLEVNRRNPTLEEIANLHADWRAFGPSGAVRLVPELLGTAMDHVGSKLGLSRRVRDADQNRSRAAKAAEDASRARRGLPPVDRGEQTPRPQANARSGDRIATESALQDLTRSAFGMWDPDQAAQADAKRKAIRSEAIAEITAVRLILEQIQLVR